MLKATKVDGIYTADPKKDASATRYDEVTYDEALGKRLGVLDQTAMVLCRDHHMKLCVYDMSAPGALLTIVSVDTSIGTRVNRASNNFIKDTKTASPESDSAEVHTDR